MSFIYHEVGIEVTRKCNENCSNYCMRGNKQNLDINTSDIDKLLDNEFERIDTLFFSGGEPTLNAKAISYTINKIISENIPVRNVSLITNGKIYSQEIVDAFEKFNYYSNAKFMEYLISSKEINDYSKKKLVKLYNNSWSSIVFSNNQYHDSISEDILNKYKKSEIINYSFTGKKDDVLKSGYSISGRELDTNTNIVRVFSNLVFDLVYLTAKGNLSVFGDGSFDYLDEYSRNNYVGDTSLDDFVLNNLSPSSRIISNNKKYIKKKR